MASNDIVKILTHLKDAKDRLIQQYKERPKIEGLLDAFDEQIQDLETVFCELLEERLNIDVAVGQQLDNIGILVGRSRGNFDDETYRIFLKVQIQINISSGEPERLIEILNAITDAEFISLQEWYPASFGIGISEDISGDLLDFYYQILDQATAAGVRLDWLWCFSETEAFSFDGAPSQGTLGFGSNVDPIPGGELGSLKPPSIPKFSFFALGDEENAQNAGFSTVEDPLVGGILQSL